VSREGLRRIERPQVLVKQRAFSRSADTLAFDAEPRVAYFYRWNQ
jgi:hypothetical protein